MKIENIISYNLIVIIFMAMVYKYIGKDHFNHNNSLNSFSDYLYYSIITHVSIGYGDISPKTQLARRVVSMHSIIMLFLII
jgi:uncharacterized membrane protein